MYKIYWDHSMVGEKGQPYHRSLYKSSRFPTSIHSIYFPYDESQRKWHLLSMDYNQLPRSVCSNHQSSKENDDFRGWTWHQQNRVSPEPDFHLKNRPQMLGYRLLAGQLSSPGVLGDPIPQLQLLFWRKKIILSGEKDQNVAAVKHPNLQSGWNIFPWLPFSNNISNSSKV